MDAMTTRVDDLLSPKDKQELEAATRELISEFSLWRHGDNLLRMEWTRKRCASAGDKSGEEYITKKMRDEKAALILRARQMGKTTQFIKEMMSIFAGIPPEPPSDDEIAARCIEMVRNPPAVEILPLSDKPFGTHKRKTT